MFRTMRPDPRSMTCLHVLAAIMVLCPITLASENDSFMDIDAILECWEANYGGIRSMKAVYTEQVLEAKAPPTDPNRLDTLVRVQHVDRVEEGTLYHIRYSMADKGFESARDIMEHSFDGRHTRELWGMTNFGTVDAGLVGRNVETMNLLKSYMLSYSLDSRYAPKEYREQYPNGIPEFARLLREGIANSCIKVRRAIEQVAGESCHVIELSDGRGNPRRKIWLAHEKGMLPMKHQTFRDGTLVYEIVVEDIAATHEGREGIWYPVKAQRMSNYPGRGLIRYELRVTDFVLDIETTEDMFRVHFPLGTKILDNVLGVEYVAGATDPDKVKSVIPPSPDSEPRRTTEDIDTRHTEFPVAEAETDEHSEDVDGRMTTVLAQEISRDSLWWVLLIACGGIATVLGVMYLHRRSRRRNRDGQ